MEKGELKKYAGIGLLCVALGTATGITIIENNVDHTKELCPFVQVLGIDHQINEVFEKDNCVAYYQPSINEYTEEEARPLKLKLEEAAIVIKEYQIEDGIMNWDKLLNTTIINLKK